MWVRKRTIRYGNEQHGTETNNTVRKRTIRYGNEQYDTETNNTVRRPSIPKNVQDRLARNPTLNFLSKVFLLDNETKIHPTSVTNVFSGSPKTRIPKTFLVRRCFGHF